MRTKIAIAIYFIVGIVNIVVGYIYFTSDQFLSYHSQAVGTPWQQVDTGAQTLVLALMKVAGGGWLTLGFFTCALAIDGLCSRCRLSRWLLPAGTVIFYLCSFAATWSVYETTGAASPWMPSIALVVVALVALLIDAPWITRNSSELARDRSTLLK